MDAQAQMDFIMVSRILEAKKFLGASTRITGQFFIVIFERCIQLRHSVTS